MAPSTGSRDRVAVHQIDVAAQVVGQGHFLEKADQKERQAVRDALPVDLRRALQLRQQIVSPLDRPGHQLRKERHERQEADEAAFRLDRAEIGVDRVAHRLERVKRDADGQDDFRDVPIVFVLEETSDKTEGGIDNFVGQCRMKRSPQEASMASMFVSDEFGILKEPEKAEIADQADNEPELARALPAFHQQDHPVVDGRGAEEQQQQPGIPPAIKGVRSDHEPNVHGRVVPAQEQVPGEDDQEEDEENPGVEGHGG